MPKARDVLKEWSSTELSSSVHQTRQLQEKGNSGKEHKNEAQETIARKMFLGMVVVNFVDYAWLKVISTTCWQVSLSTHQLARNTTAVLAPPCTFTIGVKSGTSTLLRRSHTFTSYNPLKADVEHLHGGVILQDLCEIMDEGSATPAHCIPTTSYVAPTARTHDVGDTKDVLQTAKAAPNVYITLAPN
jgi:hypothetical protein